MKRYCHFFYAGCCTKVFDRHQNFRISQASQTKTHKSNKDAQIQKDVWMFGVFEFRFQLFAYHQLNVLGCCCIFQSEIGKCTFLFDLIWDIRWICIICPWLDCRQGKFECLNIKLPVTICLVWALSLFHFLCC